MKLKIDCKYAKSYNGKHLKCKRNGCYRNIQKKNCTFYCPFYKKKFWTKLRELFMKKYFELKEKTKNAPRL